MRKKSRFYSFLNYNILTRILTVLGKTTVRTKKKWEDDFLTQVTTSNSSMNMRHSYCAMFTDPFKLIRDLISY